MARLTSSLAFYCRSSKADKRGLAPLEISIIINGKRLFCHLPRKERPEEFQKAIRQKRDNDLKRYLDQIRTKFNAYQTELLQNNIPITSQTLKDCFKNGGVKSFTVRDLFDGYLNILSKRVGINLTMSAYRKYELTKELFLGYMDGNKEVQAITPGVIHGFYAEIQHKYKSSTACSFMTKLKTFIQYGLDNGYLRINPFQAIKLVKEKPTIDYLTDGEIEALKTTQIDNRSLSNVRDAFLLQIFSGLSFIDLEHLTRDDIKLNEAGVYYISKERIKTKVQYTSVILPEGVEVLKRHDFKVPVISNQKMNMFLKQVMLLCGIEHRLITHLGRKTYAHILLNKGVRLETVARSLGHSSSRTTARYYTELTPETTINEVKQAFK